jgi:hypothetical protein
VATCGLDHPPAAAELAEPFVDQGAALVGGLHQVRDGRAARPDRDQGGPQRRIRVAALSVLAVIGEPLPSAVCCVQ